MLNITSLYSNNDKYGADQPEIELSSAFIGWCRFLIAIDVLVAELALHDK